MQLITNGGRRDGTLHAELRAAFAADAPVQGERQMPLALKQRSRTSAFRGPSWRGRHRASWHRRHPRPEEAEAGSTQKAVRECEARCDGSTRRRGGTETNLPLAQTIADELNCVTRPTRRDWPAIHRVLCRRLSYRLRAVSMSRDDASAAASATASSSA